MDSVYYLGSNIYYKVLNFWWDTNYHMYTWKRWVVKESSCLGLLRDKEEMDM